MDSKQYDDRTEAFYKETGIWPPGRDMPSAMCGGDDLDRVRMLAYRSWSRLQQKNERLRAALQTYGRHSTPDICCEASKSSDRECNCGFNQALKGDE